MRKFFSAAALAATVIAAGLSYTTKEAQAGLTHYTLCWTAAWGGSQCVHLPRNYRIPGVAKPRIPDGRVEFTLTRTRIRCILERYVSTADMHPGQQATIYAPKY